MSSGWLTAKYVEEGLGQTAVIIDLRTERLADGLNSGTIRVRTSDDAVPLRVITVRAVGFQPLRAIPSQLVLRAGEQKRIRFVDGNGEPVTIISIDSSDIVDAQLSEDGSLVLRRRASSDASGAVCVRVVDSRGMSARVLVHMPQ
ncbi:MAG: hypothetical protein ABIG44_17295 [Planctomycetota bacterium]